MSKKVRTGLVASGSGTDANSVMAAYRAGQLLPECEIVGLLSTKADAGCLDKAAAHQIPTAVIERYGIFHDDKLDRNRKKTQKDFESEVSKWFWDNEIHLVFLLGCIHRMPTDCLAPHIGRIVAMLNIHPADPKAHGGQGMYGLEPHEHVLAEILDCLKRGQANLDADWFFTYPTVHRVTTGYDQGSLLMQVAVPIPKGIIIDAERNLAGAAQALQKVVLPVEHLMLPAAVNIAVRLILDGDEPIL